MHIRYRADKLDSDQIDQTDSNSINADSDHERLWSANYFPLRKPSTFSTIYFILLCPFQLNSLTEALCYLA